MIKLALLTTFGALSHGNCPDCQWYDEIHFVAYHKGVCDRFKLAREQLDTIAGLVDDPNVLNEIDALRETLKFPE